MNALKYLSSIGINDPVIISLFLIVVLGVGLQWLAQLKKIPGIVLLLPAGMFFGAYLNLINPTSLFGESYYTLITVGVGFLLFAGGIHLDFGKLYKEERITITKIIPINTFLALVGGTIAITYLFSIPWFDSLLIAALLIVSGPTVIGPILNYANPKPKLRHVANWEAIITDPLGAVIATIILYALLIIHNPQSVLHSESSPFNSIIHIILQSTIFNITPFSNILVDNLLITAIFGVIIGSLLGLVIGLIYIDMKRKGLVDEKYHLLILWMFVFGGILIGEILFPEAGLFTAIVMGMVIANKEKRNKTIVNQFNGFMEPIIIGILFIVLSSMVNIDNLIKYLVPSLILVFIYVVILRPLTAFLATTKRDFTFKEKLFLGFIHPRGIVAAASASLFSLKLNAGGIHIPQLVPVVFIVILSTVVIYGLLNPYITKKLGLNVDED